MKLYYSPGACSLATNIVLHEVGMKFDLEPVNLKTKHYKGGDFWQVNPKGYVPVLQLDSGEILTEGVAIMQYIADQKPEAGLMPKAGTLERYHAQEWLNFVSSEIHKGFSPLWIPSLPESYRETVLVTLGKRFDYLSNHLSNRQFLMGAQLTAADAYLFTVLSWTGILKVDLTKWPVLLGFMERVKNRPAVQAAMKAEGILK